jgi:hypothetical protein
LSSSLTAQTKYPYELIKGKDTTVTMLKSQAVYLNQTIAKQKIKLNEIKTEYDSTKAEYTVLDSIIKNQQPIVKVDTVVLTKEVPLLIQPTAKGLSKWGMGFSGGSLNSYSDLSNISIESIEGSSQFISYTPDNRWSVRGTLTQGNIKGSRYLPVIGTQSFKATLYSAELNLVYNIVSVNGEGISIIGGNGFAHSHRYLTSYSNPQYPLMEVNAAGGVWTIFTTLGAEVNINLTKSVKLIAGSKVNIYSTDDLDALAGYGLENDNDIIQYTYLGLAFRFSK